MMGEGSTMDGEHRIQHTDDILENCTLETYIISLTVSSQ